MREPAISVAVRSADWLPILLQIQDSSFPTGGYAHSFGLEELAQLGLVSDELTLTSYLCRQVVPALIRLELPFVAAAYMVGNYPPVVEAGMSVCPPFRESTFTPSHRRAEDTPASTTGEASIQALCDLDAQYAALRAARESRAASARIGTRRLATWLKVRPGDPALTALQTAIEAGRLDGHHVIVFPTILRAAPLEIVLTAYAHQTLAGLCTAALKLIRIGQEGTQRALAGALAEVAPRLSEAAAIPVSAAGWFDPLTEIASARHETAFSRLFIS